MWSDNETNRDFLNFGCVADTAAEIIIQADGQPLSLGISGGWGTGKSSMLNLISQSLKGREDERFLFVEFNAWLYQGFDDARAALMEVIARRLVKHGEVSARGLDKAKGFLSRVNWLRVASATAGSALSISAGIPPIWLLGTAWSTLRDLVDGKMGEDEIESAAGAIKSLLQGAGELSSHTEDSSAPRRIEDLRRHFQDTLEEMDVTLVVFIDDLDRCLPSTAISTLEAIRLFLFLPRTAFIVAADDRMIRQAVRIHFDSADLDDDLVTSYFDKLVQIPLRVPLLGTQEVRAYLMLLYTENSITDADVRERIRVKVCQRLSESWRGHRVDLNFMLEIIEDCPNDLHDNLELADRLAPLMTSARQIGGNPRLIKRFLNTLAIRMSIARAQQIAVDEGALAKMLLFERCASEEAYGALISAINEDDGGKPTFLTDWEDTARAGERIEDQPAIWADSFIQDWLALPPEFADMDLRPVVYVSREHMPIITPMDQLSSEPANILEALLTLEDTPNITLTERMRGLPGREIAMIVERLMVRARQEQAWGTPPVLWGLLTSIDAEPEQAHRFSRFLETIQPALLQADIVPVLGDRPWARDALKSWSRNSETPAPVRRAIDAIVPEVS